MRKKNRSVWIVNGAERPPFVSFADTSPINGGRKSFPQTQRIPPPPTAKAVESSSARVRARAGEVSRRDGGGSFGTNKTSRSLT
ncbi:hypothetical protein MNBD_ALPHA05-1963 [hydrothermal vent metagenome]|uniref:Uncharacterized protein n=1 Tax=hydrothermal vent metagenome TaxID=652676 RepID=A0A3B0RIG1_9ZZZZ